MKRLVSRMVGAIKREGLISLMWKSSAVLSHILLTPFFIVVSKLFYGRKVDLDRLIHFAATSCNKILEVSQEPQEIYSLLAFAKNKEVQACMEIGTAKGGTLFLLSRIISERAVLISLDLPYGKFGGGYFGWRIPLYKSFVSWKQKMVLIRDDSHQEAVKRKVTKILNKRELDLLFIDGDHSYEGVKQDFEDYSRLVGHGGLIAFHDILVHGMEGDVAYGVCRFWEEIKKNYPYREFHFDKGPGIGVIEFP